MRSAQACAGGTFFSTSILMLPPAFSIAATAPFEAEATSKESFAVSSPTPRILTPSRGFEQTPDRD